MDILNFFKKLFNKIKPTDYYKTKFKYTYIAVDSNRNWWRVYTHPIKEILGLYQKELGEKPLSFFDCGCSNGHMMYQAEKMGLTVNGIDIKEYPNAHKNVETGSILDYETPIKHDLVYCNEVLTCVKEEEIPLVLNKFKNAKMLIATHLTTEDDEQAGGTKYRAHTIGPRVIKSQKWWIDCFDKNGFNAKYHEKPGCFTAKSRQRDC